MKNVLVTGAFGGMGRATVSALLSKGYRVFALDKKIGDAEDNLIPIEVDITSEKSVVAAVGRVGAYTDKLDAIIHFAGIYMLDSLVEMDAESFRRIFEINLFGAYRVNKTFLTLLKRGSRVVIATSELAPLDPLPFTGIYAITKAALDKYAYSLRMELQLLGIRVSVLRPGAVATSMLGVSTSELDSFCERTELYSFGAGKFKDIVMRVEARKIPPERVGKLALKIVNKRKPRHVYKINRNPLLLLLNALPDSWQTAIIGKILK